MKKVILLSILCLVFLSLAKLVLANNNDLVISEIMYDLSGADSGREWIEVYNSGQDLVEVLTGAGANTWRFFDGSNHTLTLVQGENNLIAPQEYFVIAADAEQFLVEHPGLSVKVFDTVMSLPNSNASLALSFDAGQTQSVLAAYESAWGGAGSGFSLEKINLTQDSTMANWQESASTGGTPGQANSEGQVPEETLAPIAVANCPSSLLINTEGNFDASGSSDPQNLALSYDWDFADGTSSQQAQVTHAFAVLGEYQVALSVSNGELSDTVTCLVVVTEQVPEEPEEPKEPEENSGGGGSGPDNHWDDILISEFLPNPKGTDDAEWIELYSDSNQTIDLSGFKLQDNSARIFTINDELNLSIQAKKYLVLEKSVTGISLNNTGGDSVKLYDPEGDLLEKIEYSDTAPEDKSYARKNNDFVWTSALTPNQANTFLENLSPLAKITLKSKELLVGEKIILSAENSSDPEEGALKYEWDFGDETQGDEKTENHVYQSAGQYLVRLKVIDGENLFGEASLLLDILSAESDLKIGDIAPINFALDDLLISEFIANPTGSDDNEWLELYNNHDESIDLLGWFLDDQEGGSKPYLFSSSTLILPGEFKVFSRLETGLTLNNSNDSVRLLTPLKEVWQEFAYENIKEGQSFAWDFENQEWFINANQSPGLINSLSSANLSAVAGMTIYSPAGVYDLETKQKVIVQGVALNNTADKKSSLYLVDWDENNVYYDQIIEIYFSKKDWPEIKAGDMIEVSGEISKTDPMPRVKIKSKEDISVTDFHFDLALEELSDLNDLSEELVGDFVKVQGVVVKKSGKNIYLASDLESEAVLRVYADFSLADLEIKKGVEIIASGILTATDSIFKLTVLKSADFARAQTVVAEDLADETQLSTSTYQVDLSTRAQTVKKIFLFILVFGLIFSLVYFLKTKFYKG